MNRLTFLFLVGLTLAACRVDQPLKNPDIDPGAVAASVLSPTSFAPGQLVRLTTNVTLRDQPKAASPTFATAAVGETGTVQKPGIVDSMGDGRTYFLISGLPSSVFGGWIPEVSLAAAGPPPSPPSGCCYAAPPPLGAAGNNGTYSSPWLLQHALDVGVVPLGKDLWLRGGIYTDLYTASLSGTSPFDRIVIRPVRHERAIFRTNLTGGGLAQLVVEGEYLEFWDLEFENTNTNRTVERPQSVYNKGSHNVYVRLISRDAGHGFYNEPTAQ